MKIRLEKDGETVMDKDINVKAGFIKRHGFIQRHRTKLLTCALVVLALQNRRLRRENHALIHQITLDIDSSLNNIEQRLNHTDSMFDQFFGARS